MKKFDHIILLFIFLLVFGGCSSIKNELIPTANKGGYKVKVIKTKPKINSDELTIKGTVFDVKTGNPISYTILKVGCIEIHASSQGEYSYKTKNFKYDYFFIEVNSVGYKTIITNFLDLTNKNEVKIDFYLAEEDRPIIECEGVNYKLK
ncbi:hypothetical protein ACM55I_01260 [Flavobacterium sp. GB2R13]|uniref:hypothetical protein n=1 Tax=Flavobacterium algoris TaxID=3398733 RepID=UPI003A8939EB